MLAASAIYLTYDMGIWGDSESTGKLYKSICDAVLPNIVEPQVREKTLTPSCQAERELFHVSNTITIVLRASSSFIY